MRVINSTDLRKNFYRLIDEVADGKPFIVTRYGKPIGSFGVIDEETERKWHEEQAAIADQSV
jgi:prevent-host-death family protein